MKYFTHTTVKIKENIDHFNGNNNCVFWSMFSLDTE